MLDDGQPQSQSTRSPRCSAVALAEALKYVRQHRLADARSVVADYNLMTGFFRLNRDFNAVVPGAEFDGAGQQIPNDLLYAVAVAINNRLGRIGIDLNFDGNPFGVGRS